MNQTAKRQTGRDIEEGDKETTALSRSDQGMGRPERCQRQEAATR